MERLARLGGSYDGRLEIGLIEQLDRDRCLARLRLMARAWDAEREQWSWDDREHLELERVLLRTDALVAFAEALKTWAALPLARLRLPSFTYETELARGWPERVSIALGPLPRYSLGDRALLKVRVVAGGREILVTFGIDVSGAAVFVDEFEDAMSRLARSLRR